MHFFFFLVFLICVPSVANADPSAQVGNLSASCAANQVLQGFRNGSPICHKIENLIPQGASPKLQVFSLSGTWTNSGTVISVHIRVVGGGGGGYVGRAGDLYTQALGGSGGGGGGYCEKIIDVSAIRSVTVTVGSGGAGGTSAQGNSDGADGGESSFGAHCTATGGQGAKHVGSKISPGSGGVGYNGDINLRGQSGTSSLTNGRSDLSLGTVNVHGMGGSSVLGVGGTAPGSVGELYGGGGAGGLEGEGGSGAPGVVIIKEY